MKKKFIAAISGALALFAFASCGQTTPPTTFTGSYWNQNTASETPVGKEEVIEYKVYSVDEKDGLWNKTQQNDYLGFKTTTVTDDNGKTLSSRYKTSLVANEDGTYLYKTSLTVYGSYEVKTTGDVHDFTDVTETETLFEGINKGFNPIKSVKTVDNTVPYSSKNGYDFKRTRYTSTINYADGNAVAKIEIHEGDESGEQFYERAKKDIEAKNYAKNGYIDINLMLLLFRNFKHEANMSYSFKTLEPLSGELQSVVGSVYTRTSTEKNSATYEHLYVCSLKNVLLGAGSPRYDYSFNVVRMDFSTSGTTGQTFMRAYYSQGYEGESETNQNSSRHIPVMIAQPTIFNTGFLVYELDKASFI